MIVNIVLYISIILYTPPIILISVYNKLLPNYFRWVVVYIITCLATDLFGIKYNIWAMAYGYNLFTLVQFVLITVIYYSLFRKKFIKLAIRINRSTAIYVVIFIAGLLSGQYLILSGKIYEGLIVWAIIILSSVIWSILYFINNDAAARATTLLGTYKKNIFFRFPALIYVGSIIFFFSLHYMTEGFTEFKDFFYKSVMFAHFIFSFYGLGFFLLLIKDNSGNQAYQTQNKYPTNQSFNKDESTITNHPFFMLNIGFLLYYAATWMVFLGLSLLYELELLFAEDKTFILSLANMLLNIIKNVLIAYGIYRVSRNTTFVKNHVLT